jgi:hypothetical protein
MEGPGCWHIPHLPGPSPAGKSLDLCEISGPAESPPYSLQPQHSTYLHTSDDSTLRVNWKLYWEANVPRGCAGTVQVVILVRDYVTVGKLRSSK